MPPAGVADALQRAGGQPVGLVPGEGIGDQAEGPLGLPVGQLVRAVVPARDHAQPPLLVPGQAGQCLVHPGEVGGPVIGLGQAHAGQQGADFQLPGAHADGQHGLDPRRDAGGVDDLLERRQRGHDCRAAPSSRTAVGLVCGFQPGYQVTEPLGAADPGGVHERGQPQQPRAVPQPGRPQPGRVQPRQAAAAVQRGHQRVRQVPAAGIGPADDQAVPGETGCRQQRGMVAGQHRDPAGPGAAHGDHDPAGPACHIGAAHLRAGRRGSVRRRRPGRPARPRASAAAG